MELIMTIVDFLKEGKMQIYKRKIEASAPNSYLDQGDADYDTTCIKCGSTPTIHPTQICTCCFELEKENQALDLKFFMENA